MLHVVRSSRIGTIAAAVVIGCAWWAVASEGASSKLSARSLHRNFRQVDSGVQAVWPDGRYVFIKPNFGSGGTIIDEQTGKRTTVSVPDCFPDALGGPYLVLACATSLRLYSPADGSTKFVAPNPRLKYAPMGCDTIGCFVPDEVGSDWVRYQISCYHCGGYFIYQNLNTGSLVKAPARVGHSTIVNLNSRSLTLRACPPLKVPAALYGDGYGEGPGLLVRYGRLALSIGVDSQIRPVAYLERCGSKARQVLTRYANKFMTIPIASSSRSIVWQSARHTLTGVYLPSLDRFTIRLPTAIRDVRALEQTQSNLYVLGGNATLYATQRP